MTVRRLPPWEAAALRRRLRDALGRAGVCAVALAVSGAAAGGTVMANDGQARYEHVVTQGSKGASTYEYTVERSRRGLCLGFSYTYPLDEQIDARRNQGQCQRGELRPTELRVSVTRSCEAGLSAIYGVAGGRIKQLRMRRGDREGRVWLRTVRALGLRRERFVFRLDRAERPAVRLNAVDGDGRVVATQRLPALKRCASAGAA